jgi:hypothetical protein
MVYIRQRSGLHETASPILEDAMSNNEDKPVRRESAEVVRLKVDGARSVVNTLRDQQTARGISLVCPFPALEVEIPVSFGTGPSDALRRGTVHRIGVEDDPETGLPRLRLSIRAHESRATVVAPPSASLIDEASRMTEASDESADTDLSLGAETTAEDSSLEELFDDDLLELEPDSPTHAAPEELTFVPLLDDEPAWVGCGELSLPDEIAKRTRKRTRRALTSVMAWLMVIGVAAGGLYVLKRTGVVDVESLRDRVAGFVTSTTAPEEPRVAELEPPAPVTEPSAATEPEAAPAPDLGQAPELALDEVSSAEPTFAAPFDEPPADEGPALLEEEGDDLEGEPEDEIAAASEPEPGAETASGDEVSLMLPTRWPAEYANAYRMRNPNGVVVDVPGGLVRREGWLEIGKRHPMIKSIKAVQRETGARFVIFVNGELPRFMTIPRPTGVSVKLFREGGVEPAATEQVALLD